MERTLAPREKAIHDYADDRLRNLASLLSRLSNLEVKVPTLALKITFVNDEHSTTGISVKDGSLLLYLGKDIDSSSIKSIRHLIDGPLARQLCAGFYGERFGQTLIPDFAEMRGEELVKGLLQMPPNESACYLLDALYEASSSTDSSTRLNLALGQILLAGHDRQYLLAGLENAKIVAEDITEKIDLGSTPGNALFVSIAQNLPVPNRSSISIEANHAYQSKALLYLTNYSRVLAALMLMEHDPNLEEAFKAVLRPPTEIGAMAVASILRGRGKIGTKILEVQEAYGLTHDLPPSSRVN